MNKLSILSKLLDPVGALLTPEVAQRIASYQADAETQSQLDQFAAKANEGLLTDAERREYEQYISAIDLITVLQIKARTVLKNHHASV